jgi:putative chitinase
MITLSQFQQMIPTSREAAVWHPIALEMFKKYEINTPNRIAGFMAQCAHESSDFRVLEENLNYSAERLVQVFPRYFAKGKANPADYARNPEKLANYVYMDVNRTKSGALGNTRPGDGWRFRGGGIKQLTGRNNFTRFGQSIGMSPEQAADYVRTRQGAFESACWFWQTNNLARYADRDDIDGMSRKVNGGTIGLDDRRTRYNRAKTILSSAPASSPAVNPQITDAVTAPRPVTYSILRRGSSGDLVKRVQKALNISADGAFGLQTDIAVRSWQRMNKYPSNGILDNTQIKKLLGE